jgi:hypothetical protein
MSVWTKLREEDGQNMSARTGLGHDNRDRTTVTGQPAQESRIVTTRLMGHVSQRGQDAQLMTART